MANTTNGVDNLIDKNSTTLAPVSPNANHQNPNSAGFDSIFQLPSKTSKAIKIKVPEKIDIGKVRSLTQDASLQGLPTQGHVITGVPPTLEQDSKQRLQRSNHAISNTQPRLENTLSFNHQGKIPINTSLNIYANNYVSLWLQAVNESDADVRYSASIPHIDFASYIAQFAGQSFLQPQPNLTLPSLATLPVLPDILDVAGYKHYWSSRLQHEFSEQFNQLRRFILYNVTLESCNGPTPEPCFYKLKIPGLRENAPRVDLGDNILIRPLLHVLNGNIGNDTLRWMEHRNGPAPGFIGIQHNASVWAVLRAREEVILRIEHLGSLRQCNALVPLQDHKCVPTWRAIHDISAGLCKQTPKLWLHSMLFPKNEDGEIQDSLSRGTFDLEWIDQDLNYEQKRAAYSVITANYGRVPYLISGPPGTGKTKTLVEITAQLLKCPTAIQHHILICAASDTAADILTDRLSQFLNTKELFRLNSWTRLAIEVPGSVLPRTYADMYNTFSLHSFKDMMQLKVVVTTCRDADILVQARLTNRDLHGIMSNMVHLVSPSAHASLVDTLHWTTLLIDEAAQATEPECLIPLSVVMPPDNDAKPTNSGPQVVMAGDEHQLGPRLATKAKDGHEISLFQRLFERDFYSTHPLSRLNGLRPLKWSMLPIIRPAFTNLIRNYRSHPAILSTSSALFYNDTLIPERKTSEAILGWPGWQSKWPVMFITNEGLDSVESVVEGDGTGAGSIMNYDEVNLAYKAVWNIKTHLERDLHPENQFKQEDIIVMSPFTAQVNQLRKLFRARGLSDVSIGPLEAFQGLERRIVVICTTRTRLGLSSQPSKFVLEDQARSLGIIDEPKRLNVALTRAEEALIIIGNPKCLTCTGDKHWTTFLDFCHRNNCISPHLTAPTWKQNPTPIIGKLERALKYAERATQIKAYSSDRPSSPSNGASAHRGHYKDPTSMDTSVINKRHRVRLKGTMFDLDEEMWQLKELALAEGSELVDLNGKNTDIELESGHTGEDEAADYENDAEDGLLTGKEEDDDGHAPLIDVTSILSNVTNMLSKKGEVDKVSSFDRDVIEEIERAGCETQ